MQIHCPQCGKGFTPPSGSDLENIQCPSCHERFNLAIRETVQVPEDFDGPDTVLGPHPSDSLTRDSMFGAYRIIEEVGRGGMGIVYRATQTSLDRTVAIKVLPRSLGRDPEFVERFNREAKTLAMLGHPNIVSIIDKGVQEDQYFFIMEWIDGLSLRDVMNESRLNPAQALRIIPEICSALEYAHSMGVIHRDIKPENILLNKQGQVKIADFGLSKIVSGDRAAHGLTKTNMTMGTVNYMAPEQREQTRDVDHRADLFSLGVVFYEMLTGELPMGRFDPPSRKNIAIDIRLDEVVLKVLQKDPDRRYQKASEISDAVTHISQRPARRPMPDPASGEGNALAIISLVLGILSLLTLTCMCPLLAIAKTSESIEKPRPQSIRKAAPVKRSIGFTIPKKEGKKAVDQNDPPPADDPKKSSRKSR